MASTAGFLWFAQAAGAQAPCEAELPTIDQVAVIEASHAGATLQAQINPHGHETAYEFLVVWQESNPPHGEPPPATLGGTRGRIPAGSNDATVSAQLTGLQPGYVYWYEVVASSVAGERRSQPHEFNYFYTGGFPEGTGSGPLYHPAQLCWVSESARLVAEEAVREQRAEELAKAAEEAARKRREEQGAARYCRVPGLRGDTLRRARRALTRAHCRLGRVTRPRHDGGALIVTRQSPRRGRTLSYGASVTVTLGSAPRHRLEGRADG